MLSFICSWRRRTSLASSVHDEGKDRREQSNKLHTTIGGETTSHEIDKSKDTSRKNKKKKYAWVRVGINRIYSPSMITIAMKNVQFTIFVLFAHKLLIVSSKDSFFSLQFFFYIYCFLPSVSSLYLREYLLYLTRSFQFFFYIYCFLQAFRVCIYENIFYI